MLQLLTKVVIEHLMTSISRIETLGTEFIKQQNDGVPSHFKVTITWKKYK